MTKYEALKMAIEALEDAQKCLMGHLFLEKLPYVEAINACKEALEQPAEPRLVSYAPDGSTCTLNIDGEEVYFNREQPTQEPVAWMKSALDNARDVCKYLDHDMVKEAKAHTQFFWNDLDKIREFDNTHPHQWVGLTDEEKIKAFKANHCDDLEDAFMCGIQFAEVMLKEKNYVL